MTDSEQTYSRSRGDDEIVQLRVRSANLPMLVKGVTLGQDDITRGDIVLQLVPEADGTYAILVVTNGLVAASAVPEPVDVERGCS